MFNKKGPGGQISTSIPIKVAVMMRFLDGSGKVNDSPQERSAGGTTAQAKFNNPTSDCNSRSVAVRFPLNALIVCLNLINLSSGRRISKFSEPISNPMNVNVVVGNTVFLDWIGRLIS